MYIVLGEKTYLLVHILLQIIIIWILQYKKIVGFQTLVFKKITIWNVSQESNILFKRSLFQ